MWYLFYWLHHYLFVRNRYNDHSWLNSRCFCVQHPVWPQRSFYREDNNNNTNIIPVFVYFGCTFPQVGFGSHFHGWWLNESSVLVRRSASLVVGGSTQCRSLMARSVVDEGKLYKKVQKSVMLTIHCSILIWFGI